MKVMLASMDIGCLQNVGTFDMQFHAISPLVMVQRFSSVGLLPLHCLSDIVCIGLLAQNPGEGWPLPETGCFSPALFCPHKLSYCRTMNAPKTVAAEERETCQMPTYINEGMVAFMVA